MKPVSFCLSAWSTWTVGHSPEETKAVPSLLRRRVTAIGQRAINASLELPEISKARIVLSSRHGEFSRTLSVLNAVVARDNLSPADFSLSVHHALTGLLSIAHGNALGHIAVASGEESFCFGLMESVAFLHAHPETPVVLIHYDEPLPGPFSTFNKPDEQAFVLALALNAQNNGNDIQLGFEPPSEKVPISSSHASDFLAFLGQNSPVCVSKGEHHQWRWTRHARD